MFGQLLRGFRRQTRLPLTARAASRRAGFRPGLEELEARLAPVTAVFDKGVLTITGDANTANDIKVTVVKVGTFEQFRVTDNGRNVPTTRPDGTARPVYKQNVVGLVLTAGQKDDTLDISGLPAPNTMPAFTSRTLNAGAGNDTLIGDQGNDTYNGGSGTDTVIVGPGDDTINGGTGTDTISFGTINPLANALKVGGTKTINEAKGGTATLDFSGLGVNPHMELTQGVTLDLSTTAKQQVAAQGGKGFLWLVLNNPNQVKKVIGNDQHDTFKFNNYTGSVSIDGGKVDGGKGINTVEIQGRLAASQVQLTNIQYIDVDGAGSKFVVDSDVSTQTLLVYQGTVQLSGANRKVTANVHVYAKGVLFGPGTIDGNLSNAGLVSPSAPSAVGQLTITGNYTQRAKGLLTIAINGPMPGTGYDQLVVGKGVKLAGTLAVYLAAGARGSPYTIIVNQSPGAVAGTFTGLAEGAAVAGGKLTITYKGNPPKGNDKNGNDVVLSANQRGNLPPVANDDNYAVAQNTPLTVPAPGVLANDTDPNGYALTATLEAGPADGALALSADGSFTYTPNAGFYGTDSFTYTAYDGVLSSDVAPVTIAVTRVSQPTTTAVSAAPDPSVFGQPVDFTATVAPASPGAGVPTGSVQFEVDGSPFGAPVPLVDGSATSDSLATLSVGPHTAFAVYEGDANDLGSTSPSITQQVNPADTTLALSSSTSTVGVGQPIDFTATLAAVAPGSFVVSPTGTVTLYDTFNGSTTALTTLDASGSLSTALGLSGVGTHVITASYSGDDNFNGSTSAPVSVTVTLAATSVTLSSSAPSSVCGQPVNFTATVAPASPTAGTPTGTVQFLVDGSDFGAPVPLVGGSATSPSLATLPAGPHFVTAFYSGDANFAPNDGFLTQQVNPADTTLVLTSSSPVANYGDPLSFFTTLYPVAPGSFAIPPTGTTTVYDTFNGSTTVLFTIEMGGWGSFPPLAVGTHIITAVYSGDANFNGCTSDPITQVINPPGS